MKEFSDSRLKRQIYAFDKLSSSEFQISNFQTSCMVYNGVVYEGYGGHNVFMLRVYWATAHITGPEECLVLPGHAAPKCYSLSPVWVSRFRQHYQKILRVKFHHSMKF